MMIFLSRKKTTTTNISVCS